MPFQLRTVIAVTTLGFGFLLSLTTITPCHSIVIMATTSLHGGSSNIGKATTSTTTTTTSRYQWRRLLDKEEDQECIWLALKHAAHETDDVRNYPLLQPYGLDFGKVPGDFGVGVFLVETDHVVDGSGSSSTNRNNNNKDKPPSVSPCSSFVGAAWIRNLHDRGGLCQVANDDDSDLPELAMAVLPPHQGQGIGTALLQRLLDELKKAQQPQQATSPPPTQGGGGGGLLRGLCLSCRTDNAAAMRLYQRMGFVTVPGSEKPNRAGGTSVNMVCYFCPQTKE